MKYTIRLLTAFIAVMFAAHAAAQCVPNLDVAGLISQNSANVIDASARSIAPDDSIDDTEAMNATFSELAAKGGGTLAITKPGIYNIGGNSSFYNINFTTGDNYRAALRMPSKTGLYLARGVVLRLAAGANRLMLMNSDPVSRNTDISVWGEGEFRNDQTQSIDNTPPEFYPGHTVAFVGIDRFYFGGGLRFNCTNSSLKYATQFADITEFAIQNVHFDEVYSDSVHLSGNMRNGSISWIYSTAVSGHGDDVVGCGTSEGGRTAYYPEICGTSDDDPRINENLSIHDIYIDGNYRGITLFGRVTDKQRNISISRVFGRTTAGGVVNIADDGNGTGELVGMQASNIMLSDIHATPASGYKQVNVTARNCTDVTIDGGTLNSENAANVGVVLVNQGTSGYPVAFTGASWTNGSLTLTKTGAFAKTVLTPSTVVIVTAGTSTTVGTYRVVSKTSGDEVVLDRTIGASASNVSFIICNLAAVKVRGYTVRDGLIGKMIEVASNASGRGAAAQLIQVSDSSFKLGWDGSTFGRVYSTGYADNFALQTRWTDINVEGAQNGANAPASVQGWDFGPTAFPTFHAVRGLTVRGFGSNSIVMRNQGTTTTLDASDWTIADISGNVFQVTTGSTNFRVRGSGGYTPIGSFTPTFCSGATQVLSIDWPNFQCDARKIKPTIGDRVYNTNATAAQVAAGVGPVRAVATQSASGEYSGTPTDPWSVDAIYRRQSTKTTSYTIVVGETGTLFNTDGAAGTVTFSLPAATVGQWYTFRGGSANSLGIDPNGTETIALPSTGVQGGAGVQIATTTNGATVHIACDKAGQWSVYGYTGTWTQP